MPSYTTRNDRRPPYQELAPTGTSRLIRNAKAELAKLPKSCPEPFPMEAILNDDGTTSVWTKLGKMRRPDPAPAPLPAADSKDVEASTFQKLPAYRYIRKSDKLPTYEALGDKPLAEIEARVKLFNPTGIGRWFIAAYDPDTRIAWGVAELHGREVGSFGMEELVAHRGLFGLPLERDLSWRPETLDKLLEVGP